MPGMRAVGELLRRRRDQLGWSRDEAAEESGFSSRIIAAWETAEKTPSSDNLFSYANVLEIDVRELQREYLGKPANVNAFAGVQTDEVLDELDRRMDAIERRANRELWAFVRDGLRRLFGRGGRRDE